MIEVEFTTQIRIPGKHGFERKFSSNDGWAIVRINEMAIELTKGPLKFEVHGIPYTFLVVHEPQAADPPKLVEVPKPAPKPVPMAKKGGK